MPDQPQQNTRFTTTRQQIISYETAVTGHVSYQDNVRWYAADMRMRQHCWSKLENCSPAHSTQGCHPMVSSDTRPLWHNKNIWYNPSTVFRKESLNPLQSLSMSWLLQTIQNARSRIWQTTTATHFHRSLERGLHISHWTLESISTRRRNGIQCPHVYWSSYESSITRPNWD